MRHRPASKHWQSPARRENAVPGLWRALSAIPVRWWMKPFLPGWEDWHVGVAERRRSYRREKGRYRSTIDRPQWQAHIDRWQKLPFPVIVRGPCRAAYQWPLARLYRVSSEKGEQCRNHSA